MLGSAEETGRVLFVACCVIRRAWLRNRLAHKPTGFGVLCVCVCVCEVVAQCTWKQSAALKSQPVCELNWRLRLGRSCCQRNRREFVEKVHQGFNTARTLNKNERARSFSQFGNDEEKSKEEKQTFEQTKQKHSPAKEKTKMQWRGIKDERARVKQTKERAGEEQNKQYKRRAISTQRDLRHNSREQNNRHNNKSANKCVRVCFWVGRRKRERGHEPNWWLWHFLGSDRKWAREKERCS